MKKNLGVIAAGFVVGLAALVLTALGNPANMGFCIACFLRDIAGACGLHSTATLQYIRPEIPGIVLGAFAAALIFKEFRPRGGSSAATRFLLGAVVMIGALMFLGCPLRMLIRIGGGDFNAIIGLAGFAAGIGAGAFSLGRGFSLGRAYSQSKVEGGIFPALMALLAGAAALVPSMFKLSAEGPGSQYAPFAVALIAGLAVGALAQRSRLCMAGGIRDAMLFKDFHLLWGAAAIVATVLIGNLVLKSFTPGFVGQPVAHSDGLWNFLGMALVGWGSVLLGGCPLRQLILAGEGSSDSAITVAGMVAGAAFCHNFGLASSAAGPTPSGKIAVLAGFAVAAAITVMNLPKKGV